MCGRVLYSDDGHSSILVLVAWKVLHHYSTLLFFPIYYRQTHSYHSSCYSHYNGIIGWCCVCIVLLMMKEKNYSGGETKQQAFWVLHRWQTWPGEKMKAITIFAIIGFQTELMRKIPSPSDDQWWWHYSLLTVAAMAIIDYLPTLPFQFFFPNLALFTIVAFFYHHLPLFTMPPALPKLCWQYCGFTTILCVLWCHCYCSILMHFVEQVTAIFVCVLFLWIGEWFTFCVCVLFDIILPPHLLVWFWFLTCCIQECVEPRQAPLHCTACCHRFSCFCCTALAILFHYSDDRRRRRTPPHLPACNSLAPCSYLLCCVYLLVVILHTPCL